MFQFETRLFEIWGKLQTLPPSKISDILRVGGRTVISGVPNVGVTSQIFNLECYTLDHHCISYFIAFWLILEILRNSRTLGESWGLCYFHI